MSKLWPFRWGLCIALALSCGLGGRARAQDTEYDTLVHDALAEYSAGRFLEARALFVQAHGQKPSARTLRGMGRAAFGAQLYAQAVAELAAALDSRVNALTPKMREEVEELIMRARKRVGRFSIKLDPPDSEVLVDGGSAVFDATGALLLDAGRRQLVVRAQGHVQRETLLDVGGGEDSELDLSISLAAQRNETDPLAAAAANRPEEAGSESSGLLDPRDVAPAQPPVKERPFPWLAVGAFGLAAAAGVVGIVELQHRDAGIKSWNASSCGSRANDPGCRKLQSGWHRSTTWGIVSFGLMGAFAGTGLLLLVLEPGRERQSHTTVACGVLLNGVSCALRM